MRKSSRMRIESGTEKEQDEKVPTGCEGEEVVVTDRVEVKTVGSTRCTKETETETGKDKTR